jgi:hypothetical protein
MKKNTLLIPALCVAFFLTCSCKKTFTPVSTDAITTQKTASPGGNLSTFSTSSLLLESLTGPVTQNEINAFKTYMASYPTPAPNSGNGWVFGDPGKAIEACGLMYEASHDQAILDKMIFLCDDALSGRNDILSAANGGQLVCWTGNIEPVWPSSAAGVTPAVADVEQGGTLSHLAYCSLLILQNPAIWNNTVTIGDPNGFGATYKARALKYMTSGDYTMDQFIIPHFLKTTASNHYYFPGAPNPYQPGNPAPWNQAWLLTDGFTRLAQCHKVLNDAPSRVTQYYNIVKPNIDWFFANLTPNTSGAGTACYTFAYAYPSGMEDTNHFAYDSEGLWIAYNSGLYGLTSSAVLPFANTYIDVVLATVQGGLYAGLVDGTYGTGHAAGDNYVRDEYLYYSEFRPQNYQQMGNIEITQNKISGSAAITSRLLWEKGRLYTKAQTLHVSMYQNCSYGGWTASFGLGSYTTAQIVTLGGKDNDASSLKIPAGLTVTVYDGDNFTGISTVLTSDQSCLSSISFNDKVSSMKVTQTY